MAENSDISVLVTHEGGCHCGKVKWQIQAPAHLQTHTCNCSICDINNYQHLIVPKQRFQLLTNTDTPFDGQNWEENAASLAHLSKA